MARDHGKPEANGSQATIRGMTAGSARSALSTQHSALVSRRRLLAGSAVGLGALALGAACSQAPAASAPTGSAPAAPRAPERLRFVSWSQPRAEQANLFVAQDLGYYRDQGIEFEYVPGNGSGDALKQMLAGNADVGFVGPEAIYFTVDQGGDAVGIYNIYPQSIFTIVSWPETGIRTPADLRGKTIGVLSQASGSRYVVLTLLALAGLKETDVTLVATGPNPAPFLERKVDAWSSLVTTAADLQEQTGQTFNQLLARDYLNLPTDVLATTRESYTRRGDLLIRFLRAVRQGTEHMIAHPAEAAAISVQHALDIKDAAKAEKVIRAFGEASKPDGGDAQTLGTFNLTVLREGARLYQEAGLVKTRVEIERYFTNDLVARV
jgi:NitT/TauT family transport system substrate-binding protein